MRKLVAAVMVLLLLPLGFRCDQEPPPKERPCLTCAEAGDTIPKWASSWPCEITVITLDNRDTMYWTYNEVPETTITITNMAKWQRRPDRWVCKVDTMWTWRDSLAAELKYDSIVIDTTWIPKAPVFVDTTKQLKDTLIINDLLQDTGKWDNYDQYLWDARIDSAVEQAYRRMQGEK